MSSLLLLLIVLSFIISRGSGQSDNPVTHPDQENECPADNAEGCGGSRDHDGEETCTWHFKGGVKFTLRDLANKQFGIGLQRPQGSILKFHLCPQPPATQILCGSGKSLTCLSVPGVKPTSTGMELKVEQLEPNIPSMGMRLTYSNGEICQVTKMPRVTIIKVPCDQRMQYSAQNFHPKQAWEGQKKEICHYYVDFPPSSFGCPVGDEPTAAAATATAADTTLASFVSASVPEIWAVTGCHDSEPARTTEDCHYAGKIKLTLHGTNFHTFCYPEEGWPPHIPASSSSINGVCRRSFSDRFSVFVGKVRCSEVALVSQYEVNCTLEKGEGQELDVAIVRKKKALESGREGLEVGEEIVAELKGAVSFKERIDYRERFSKFVEMGVGGLKREIDELYRRAFASRGTSPELLEQLGIGHVKGILLYGPPGSGKTLLARTLGKLLGSKQVSLINGPEIISKYLGESEKNLRSHFQAAHASWSEHGLLSDLYVIIIDEIDAICKPRGKTDQSAAGVAYDALVNQLLTLMDGLNEIHNTLVVGLTNRRELLDPALLRPGRFEVQIEVSLPDEEGRREIFEIHTREMKKNGLLGSDVNCGELAVNTSHFSGAEIAGVVRAASSYALERYHRETAGLDPSAGSVLITSVDFSRALHEINPAYTHSESHLLSSFLPLGYLACGEPHNLVIDAALDMVHVLLTSSATRVQTLLLYGPRGSGKTTLAAHLAMMGKFSFVRVVTASSLVGLHDAVKVDSMYQTFRDAYKSESAVIILDDLHRLVEYVQVGHQIQVSHSLLHSLLTLLTSTPPQHSKLMVIATMTTVDDKEVALEEDATLLGLPELFMQRLLVPVLGAEETRVFVAARNIRRSEGGQFVLPGNLAIPIAQVVYAVECACARSESSCDPTRPTHVRQEHLLDCIMTAISSSQ